LELIVTIAAAAVATEYFKRHEMDVTNNLRRSIFLYSLLQGRQEDCAPLAREQFSEPAHFKS
jgi:hypothetical protein